VIVITYQRGEILKFCLHSIYRQENLPRPYELIVIDNGGDIAIEAPPDPQIKLHLERPPIIWALWGAAARL